MNDDLKSRLHKLLALAERGVGGEATNAKAALESALQKNGLTLQDIMDENRVMHGFCWKGKLERRLLAQIIATVCGAKTALFLSRNELLAKMTPGERIEIELLWTAHRRQVKKESELFYSAYLHRHRLFPEDGEKSDEELTPEQEEELERIATMMMGMKRINVRKELCTA